MIGFNDAGRIVRRYVHELAITLVDAAPHAAGRARRLRRRAATTAVFCMSLSVIDKRGVIRYKQIGIVTPDILRTKILPLVRALERDA